MTVHPAHSQYKPIKTNWIQRNIKLFQHQANFKKQEKKNLQEFKTKIKLKPE